MCRRLCVLVATLLSLTLLPQLGQTADDKDNDPVYQGIAASKVVEVVKTGKDAKRRRAAVVFLANYTIEYRDNVAVVSGVLKADPDEDVREAAANTLAQLARQGHELRKLQPERGPVAREASLAALRQALKDDTSAKVRRVAASSLSRVGLSDDPEERKKEMEIKELVEGYKAAVPLLIAALKDPDNGVRAAAVDSLGRLHEFAKDALSSLLDIVKDKKNDSIARAEAIHSVSRFGTSAAQEAVPILKDIVGDESAPDNVRRAAANALGTMKTEAGSAAAALGKALEAKALEVRRAAVSALGEIGADARDALPGLKKVSKTDDDKFVRSEAMRVMGGLTRDAAEVLPFLVAGLSDPVAEVKVAAAQALGNLGKDAEPALSTLKPLLKDNEKAVKEAAEDAISKIEKK
jgi:HEAT repeat protein